MCCCSTENQETYKKKKARDFDLAFKLSKIASCKTKQKTKISGLMNESNCELKTR